MPPRAEDAGPLLLPDRSPIQQLPPEYMSWARRGGETQSGGLQPHSRGGADESVQTRFISGDPKVP
ncbi:hypothetical protein C8Q76DRAFT_725073 [Earliella scabrosa]|nr:hypothetical protein C8Q76DRAFT_725073 [Earliella scabrosa]